MKTGRDYWGSPESERLDDTLALFVRAGLVGAKIALRCSVEKGIPLEIEQMRVGAGNGEPEDRLFSMVKLHTQKDWVRPVPKGGYEPLSRVAGFLRKLGVDEFSQADKNIKRRQMSFFGPRPLLLNASPETPGACSYTEVMDSDAPGKLKNEWGLLVKQHRPGILGHWAIHEHSAVKDDPNRFEMRMEMDLEDAYTESVANNLRILSEFAELAVRRRLR